MYRIHTFIDLFAGCGGFSLGLTEAGFKCLWAVDIDENACRTYRRNIGSHIVRADIRTIEAESMPETEVLLGGFPCQPFSISGLQHGFTGKDGDLFNQCVRAINAKKPKIFVLENVPGFANLQGGRFLREAIRVLASLGYYVSAQVLNASDYEVPQNRKRLFLMGNSLGMENLFPQRVPRRIWVQEAIDDIWRNMNAFENNVPMRHTERIVRRFAAVRPGETALDAMRRDPSLGTAKITKQCYRRLVPDEPSPTLMANFVTTTIHYCQNRNLTAREAARIQTFPDTFVFEGMKTRMSWQKGLSQFEQIGNAVPPRLAYHLGKAMKEMLEGRCEKMPSVDFAAPKAEQLPFFSVPDSSVTVQMRGRKSKFAPIYEAIQALSPGESLNVPGSIEPEFFIFLEGAMHRRGIRYRVDQDYGNAGVAIVRLT